MTVAGNRGSVAFSIQKAKIGSGAFAVPGSLVNGAWQKHKMTRVNVGIQELTDALTPSVGSGLFVDGTYKNAVVAGGQMTMEARLQGSLGYLLYAAAGSYSATAPSGTSTLHATRIYVNQQNQLSLPWMCVRRYTPGSNGSDGLTEYLVDAKVAGMVLTIPQMGPLVVQTTLSGRKAIANDAEVSGNDSNYESAAGVALSCKSNIALSFDPIGALADTYNVTDSSVESFMGAEIAINNGLTGPQQEIVVGSMYMDDLSPLTRSAVITLVYKWKNPKLYDRILYASNYGGSFSAAEWTPQIQTGSAVISSVTAAGTPSMNFCTDSINWQIAAPQLAGAQMLTTTVTGIVTETNNAGIAPWWFDMFNTYDYIKNLAAY
jgi:hypothetical protein